MAGWIQDNRGPLRSALGIGIPYRMTNMNISKGTYNESRFILYLKCNYTLILYN